MKNKYILIIVIVILLITFKVFFVETYTSSIGYTTQEYAQEFYKNTPICKGLNFSVPFQDKSDDATKTALCIGFIIYENKTFKETELFKLYFLKNMGLYGTIEIWIDSNHFTYKEIKFVGRGEQDSDSFSDSLTKDEMKSIRSVISDLTNTPSQNFAEKPLLPDQGRYRISFNIDGKDYLLQCGIYSPEEEALCQEKSDELHDVLNKVIGINRQ